VDSLQRPDSHVVADSGGGDGADADGERACSMNQLPLPGEPELAPGSGSKNERGVEAGVGGGKVSQVRLHQHPDVEVLVGSGPAQEGDDTDEEEGE